MNINHIHPITLDAFSIYFSIQACNARLLPSPSSLFHILSFSIIRTVNAICCNSAIRTTLPRLSLIFATMDSSSDLSDLSSELSYLSRSPSPPTSYPSPEPSQTRDSSVASKHDDVLRKRPRSEGDEEPPKKKRKSIEAKPRTTVHLDLRCARDSPEVNQSDQLALLLKVLRKRRKIVVIAGAGISTAAGGKPGCDPRSAVTHAYRFIVPDFRSSNGLFNTLKSENRLKASGKQLFDASVYQTDASTSFFHDMVRTLSGLVSKAKPTEFHEMLATLASEGRLLRLYTQNVDGIDTSLPPLQTIVPLDPKGPWPRTIQLHGSLDKMVCSKCNTLSTFDPEKFSGPTPSACPDCIKIDEIRTDHAGKRSHGIGKLRPRMVLYNEHNPDEEAIGRVMGSDLRARPDAVIVVGTSMEIPGVKRLVREMCGIVRDRRDGVAIWINRGPPPIAKEFENCWDLVVAGDCDRVAKQAGMRRWNEEIPRGDRVTDFEAQQAKESQERVEVLIRSPQKGKKKTPDLLTPAASPKLKPTEEQRPKIMIKLQLSTSASNSTASSRASSKAPSKKASKPRSSLAKEAKGARKKPAKKESLGRVNTVFKVTKAQANPLPKKEEPYHAPPIPKEPSQPMAPLSPQDARSNNALPTPEELSPNDKAHPITKLEKVEVQVVGAKGRLKRLSEEIVSPVGGAPPDMQKLLN